ncbi:GtrA family protein [Kitasatospora sp. NBC_01287]|uniref:GtrA family protein n=1 Tax=Kitasatospora sp. NBC_01287 TaxID=2903573 RepID=UPI0022598052|nr:GtrA family protein [Kitasatospora sp. NBC_01287]MCX4746779.1 GtrA family protein [Kitasatospora sp. NBC_01287]
MPSPTQRVLAKVPGPLRPILLQHRSLVKFLVVGGSCFLLTLVINYGLKLTVCQNKPVVALTIGTAVATVFSYILNRQWSFRSEGSHKEAIPFFAVSALAVGVNDLPLLVSRYVFDLHTPHVSNFTQEVCDFLSGMIVGTLVAMAFRYWAMKKFVFTTRADPASPRTAAEPPAPVR